jgi:hypothetical protein
MRLRFVLPLAATLACRPAPPVVAVAPASPCAGGESSYVRSVLYFGLTAPDGSVLADSSWSGFLAATVTPAFPDGFTVASATGQWRDKKGDIVREPSRMLVVLHPASSTADTQLRRIIEQYRTAFQQESVLWERAPVCVAF